MVLERFGTKMEDFESKKKALYDCLANAEKDIKGTTLDQSVAGKNIRNPLKRPAEPEVAITISKLRGKESIFKKPELPISKCLKPRITPDFKVNPHKWTKYSLADVDISDNMNSTAAFTFLKEMESKEDEEMEDAATDASEKPVFNMAVKIKRSLKIDAAEVEDKPKLKGPKLIMPEYVVGQKTEKIRKRSYVRNVSKESSRQLTLSHLNEDDLEDAD